MKRALLVVALAGCGRPTMKDPHPDDLSITVHNEAGQPICEVFIYPTHHPEPGHNWLDAQRAIESGMTRQFWVPKKDPPETFQVSITGCPKAPKKGALVANGYSPNVFMSGPAHVVLYDDGNPGSKDTATGLAHSNENTTLIPAKWTKK